VNFIGEEKMMMFGLLGFSLVQSALAEDAIADPKPFGLLHMWTTVYDMDENEVADPAGYGDPEDDVGFKLRRARFGIGGKNELTRYRVSVGMSSPFDATLNRGSEDIDLVDAYFSWKAMEGLWVSAGVQKVPVSREQIMSSSNLVLSERAVASVWMVPNREVGLLGDYTLGMGTSNINIQAGVFNGNGSLLGDDNSGKLYAGRVEYTLGKGVYRTFGKTDKPVIGIAVDGYLNQDIATQELGYGADIIVRASGVSVLGEFRMRSLTPTNTDIDSPAVLSETQQIGYLAQLGYSIGQFEPALRYSYFDDNVDLVNAGDGKELSAGVTWHNKTDSVRIGSSYVLRLEDDSYAVANDTVRLWMMLRYK
jgi:hypothetical protein